jgi:hypothetical protein
MKLKDIVKTSHITNLMHTKVGNSLSETPHTGADPGIFPGGGSNSVKKQKKIPT